MDEQKKEIVVGMRLWAAVGPFDDQRDGRSTFIIVTKVGRKYVTFVEEGYTREYRFDPSRMRECEGWPNRTIYWSKEDWANERERKHLWDTLWKFIYYSNRDPENITTEQIKAAIAALGIEYKPKGSK